MVRKLSDQEREVLAVWAAARWVRGQAGVFEALGSGQRHRAYLAVAEYLEGLAGWLQATGTPCPTMERLT